MIKWITLFLLTSSYVFSQDVTIKPESKQLITVSSEFIPGSTSNLDQYLVSKWAKGKLYYANGTFKEYDSLNFDRYGNVIETVIENKPLSVYPIGLAGALIYTGSATGYILVKAVLDGTPKLLEVRSIGKTVLASTLNTIQEVERKTIKTDDIRFVPKPEAEISVSEKFYVWNGSEWNSFKMNKSGIAKLFNLDKKEVQEVTSTNNIKTSTNEGVVALFQYFNNLE